MKNKQEILEYLTDFNSSFSTYLRPYKAELGDKFEGAASKDLTMLVHFSENVFCARIIAKRLDEAVKIWRPERIEDLFVCKFSGRLKSEQKVTASCLVKHLFGSARLGMSIDNDVQHESKNYRVKFSFDQPTGIMLLAPAVGTSAGSSGAISKTSRLHPSWLLQITSIGFGANPLEGLDSDPKLAASGVADAILSVAAVRPGPPRKRFDDAKLALETALNALSPTNEEALHAVVEQYPWIIRPEYEYRSFQSKPRLHYDETFVGDDGQKECVNHAIIPDFIYSLIDDTTLCVEIEAYNKRLFTLQEETKFKVPSSKSTKASYQIKNYRQIFETYGSIDIREQLNLPTVSLFRYLLVVGSLKQPDFDKRSWEHNRRLMHESGIELQNWDYYLDILERRAQASDFR